MCICNKLLHRSNETIKKIKIYDDTLQKLNYVADFVFSTYADLLSSNFYEISLTKAV